MRNIIIASVVVICVIFVGLMVFRFVFGGDEDTWVCVNNVWVRHGNPDQPAPAYGCGETDR